MVASCRVAASVLLPPALLLQSEGPQDVQLQSFAQESVRVRKSGLGMRLLPSLLRSLLPSLFAINIL
jgi:hypothetical protein